MPVRYRAVCTQILLDDAGEGLHEAVVERTEVKRSIDNRQ